VNEAGPVLGVFLPAEPLSGAKGDNLGSSVSYVYASTMLGFTSSDLALSTDQGQMFEVSRQPQTATAARSGERLLKRIPRFKPSGGWRNCGLLI